MKLIHACLRSCEACASQLVYQERYLKPGFTTVVVLWSSCRPVLVSVRMVKAVFSPQCWYCEACPRLFEFQDGPKKHFSPLWESSEAHTGQFEYQKGLRKHFSPLWRELECRFYYCGGHVKVLPDCLSVRGDLESIFHHCWCLVKLVHISFCVRKDPECMFYDCKSFVKLVKASLRVRKDIESCFYHCGCESCSCQFECQKLFRDLCSPLWRSC